MSPEAGKATEVQPVTQAAMIEPYAKDGDPNDGPENQREVGYWLSEADPERVPLRKNVPNFDAAESGWKVEKKMKLL